MTLEVPKILIQSSDALNAFTDASGHLVISTGAVRAMESEDELAALLGHELSHLILKHPQGKDAMKSLPLGMDTMTSVQDAAAELEGPASLSRHSEQHADQQPVVERLHRAELEPQSGARSRSERLRAHARRGLRPICIWAALRQAAGRRSSALPAHAGAEKTLVVRLRDAGSKVAASSGRAQNAALTSEVKGALADDASEKLVDSLSAFNRSHDSPDERQTALANYAREHREKTRAPHAEVHLAQIVQEGESGNLLKLDAAAIVTMNAVAARNATMAKLAMQSLGDTDSKQRFAHLHLAIGSYNEQFGDREASERAALAWMDSKRAPAQAFIWVASYQARRQDYISAIETLESGRQRVGASTPFLPTLVAMARYSGNMPLARDYAEGMPGRIEQGAGRAPAVDRRAGHDAEGSLRRVRASAGREAGERRSDRGGVEQGVRSRQTVAQETLRPAFPPASQPVAPAGPRPAGGDVARSSGCARTPPRRGPRFVVSSELALHGDCPFARPSVLAFVRAERLEEVQRAIEVQLVREVRARERHRPGVVFRRPADVRIEQRVRPWLARKKLFAV